MNCGQVVDFVSEPESDLLPYAYINTQGIWRNTQKKININMYVWT